MARRAVVLLHGVGSQQKGATLDDVVEPIIRFLHRFVSPSDPNGVRLDVEMRPEHGPAAATIRFDLDGQTETWEITEAWWAERFFASPSDLVLSWGWRVLTLQAWNVFYGIFVRHLRPPADPPYDPPYSRVYDTPDPPWFSRIYDFLVGVALLIAFVPAYVLVLALASVFFLFAQLPPWLLVPRAAAILQKELVETLVHGVGDQQAMTTSYAARDSASRALVQALAPYLDSTRPDYRRCDAATVIAHSGGCVVACDALTDREVKEWDFGAGDGQPPTPVTWFTVGSGLNFAYQVSPTDWFWDRELDPRIKWVDVWARYDPVPHGPPPAELRDRVRRLSPGPEEGPAPAEFRTLRVVNRDNPFTDHGTYWRNYEEVVSRFVYEIMGRPPDGSSLREAIEVARKEIPLHRRGVAVIMWLRFAVAITLLLLARLHHVGAALGARLLDLLTSFPGPAIWPFDQLLGWLATRPALFSLPVVGAVGADSVVGLTGLALVAYLVYRLLTLWFRPLLERGSVWR